MPKKWSQRKWIGGSTSLILILIVTERSDIFQWSLAKAPRIAKREPQNAQKAQRERRGDIPVPHYPEMGGWKTPSPFFPVREAILFRRSRIKRSVVLKNICANLRHLRFLSLSASHRGREVKFGSVSRKSQDQDHDLSCPPFSTLQTPSHFLQPLHDLKITICLSSLSTLHLHRAFSWFGPHA